MKFYCVKCERFLGECNKGAIRKGAVLLCSPCWERAKVAIEMADYAADHGKDLLNGDDSEVVDNLMGMFGMKK